MKRFSLCILLSLIFLLSGCNNKSIDTEQTYYDNVDNLNEIVTFLNEHKNIREITKENPGIFYEYPFECNNGIYYVFEDETDIHNNTELEKINKCIKDNFVRVIIDREEKIVNFQTVAKFGYGEYLIYTETGQPYDDYLFESEWINENWYTAYSGDHMTQSSVSQTEKINKMEKGYHTGILFTI